MQYIDYEHDDFWGDLFQEAVNKGASDIHCTVGFPPVYRIDGEMIYLEKCLFNKEIIVLFLDKILTERQKKRLYSQGDVDFTYSFADNKRIRGNAFLHQENPALALRLLYSGILSLAELGYPPVLQRLALVPHGLVIVTGATGAGKSTTIAAMIDLINATQPRNILTLEDPIEYIHQPKCSVVRQREVFMDTPSFAVALRAAMREDPDVLLVGEMRDEETAAATLTAALSGHLVFTTLHTADAIQTIERIVHFFPPHQQQQARTQLALVLRGAVAQQLIRRCDRPGRVVAMEILVTTPAIRNLIREGKTHQIISCLQSGGKFGMQTMESAVKKLHQYGYIDDADSEEGRAAYE